MKKIIFLFLLLLAPVSTFAWIDTDRICSDDVIYDKTTQTITVSYPWETVYVWSVWKKSYSLEPENTYMPKTEQRLYYVVNIPGKKSAELYSYNCKTHKPKLLLEISIDAFETYYSIDFIKADSLVLLWRDSGMGIGPIRTIVGYNIRSNSKLFSYKDQRWTIVNGDPIVTGFVSWKWAWFIYMSPSMPSADDAIYRLDKKTLKFMKM